MASVHHNYMTEHFMKMSDVYAFMVRKCKLNVSVPKVNSVSLTTFYYSIVSWNAFTEKSQTIKNHDSFRKEVKKHFLNFYNNKSAFLAL